MVAAAPQIGSEPGPIDVHVGAKRRRGRMIGETAGLTTDFGQGQTTATKLARHGHGEVSGLSQIREILMEEAVVPIVSGSAFRHAHQHGVRQDCGFGCHVISPDFTATLLGSWGDPEKGDALSASSVYELAA